MSKPTMHRLPPARKRITTRHADARLTTAAIVHLDPSESACVLVAAARGGLGPADTPRSPQAVAQSLWSALHAADRAVAHQAFADIVTTAPLDVVLCVAELIAGLDAIRPNRERTA